MSYINEFYEDTAERFWDPEMGPIGRDIHTLPLINSNLNGRFLEYGFGSASFLFQVAKTKKFEEVIGVDISNAVIKKAEENKKRINKNYCKKLQFITPDESEEKIPQIETDSIDCIATLATIEHILNPYATLDELYRVGKKDSTLICTVPNITYVKHRVQLLLGILPVTGTSAPIEQWREAGWDGMHIHYFTKKTLSILLRDCGWEPVEWTGWGTKFPFILPLRKRFPSLLSGEITAICKKIQ